MDSLLTPFGVYYTSNPLCLEMCYRCAGNVQGHYQALAVCVWIVVPLALDIAANKAEEC